MPLLQRQALIDLGGIKLLHVIPRSGHLVKAAPGDLCEPGQLRAAILELAAELLHGRAHIGLGYRIG